MLANIAAPAAPQKHHSSCLRRYRFVLDQRAFAGDAPAIAAERAVAAHDAVARHDHGEPIARARVRDRAHRTRRADLRRDLRVAARLSAWNALQRLPDPPLECGRADV